MKNINKIKNDTVTVVRLTTGCSNYKYKRGHEYKARIVVLHGGKKVLGITNDAGIEEYHPLTTKSFCLLEDHEAYCQAAKPKVERLEQSAFLPIISEKPRKLSRALRKVWINAYTQYMVANGERTNLGTMKMAQEGITVEDRATRFAESIVDAYLLRFGNQF